MRKNQSCIVTLASKVMEDVGDESGQPRPACAAVEMRLKPGGGGSWSKSDRPLRTKKSIDTKEQSKAVVLKNWRFMGSEASTRRRSRNWSYRLCENWRGHQLCPRNPRCFRCEPHPQRCEISCLKGRARGQGVDKGWHVMVYIWKACGIMCEETGN